MRKAAKVPYPHCYATVEQCKENVSGRPQNSKHLVKSLPSNLFPLQAKAEQFNCAQRSHSNFLENAPQTMLFTLIAGLKYPQLATAIGAAWVVLRSLYLYGYVYSGKPQGKGRLMGGMFWFAQGALWGLSVFGVARDLISF